MKNRFDIAGVLARMRFVTRYRQQAALIVVAFVSPRISSRFRARNLLYQIDCRQINQAGRKSMSSTIYNPLTHRKSFSLPRNEFRYKREGPWPQPAPDHPMGMAAEVLHPWKSEVKDWSRTAGRNYMFALIGKLPLAIYNGLVHVKVAEISDEFFETGMTTTTYSKYLKLRTAAELADSNFATRLGALDANKQYLTQDFTPIQDVKPYKGMYVAPTVTLFERDHDRAPAKVVAISIGHLSGDRWRHVVLTPEDVNAWTLAKYFVIQGAAHMVVLSGHPAAHFPYDTVNAVTQSAVPMHHALFRLLQPHLRLQLAVNHAVLEGGHSVVSETRGQFYAPFVAPGTEVRQLVAAGFLGYPHELSKYAKSSKPSDAHPRWIYPMGPKDIPSDFGRVLSAYYETIKTFVRKVVRHVLDRDGTQQGQEEIYYIRCWAFYISQWLNGFPDEHQILDKDSQGDPLLVSCLTTFIWDVSVAHSLDHRAFGLLGPHHTPFRIRVPPPDGREAPAYDRRDFTSGWDMFKSTLAFEMFFKPHNIQLLKDITYGFESETLRAAEQQFQSDLVETEKRLIADGIDVHQYIPLDEIACSIQY